MLGIKWFSRRRGKWARSEHDGSTWWDNRMVADCRGGEYRPEVEGGHEIPYRACTCGVYGGWRLLNTYAYASMRERPTFVALVDGYGRLLRYSGGWRAEKAELVAWVGEAPPGNDLPTVQMLDALLRIAREQVSRFGKIPRSMVDAFNGYDLRDEASLVPHLEAAHLEQQQMVADMAQVYNAPVYTRQAFFSGQAPSYAPNAPARYLRVIVASGAGGVDVKESDDGQTWRKTEGVVTFDGNTNQLMVRLPDGRAAIMALPLFARPAIPGTVLAQMALPPAPQMMGTPPPPPPPLSMRVMWSANYGDYAAPKPAQRSRTDQLDALAQAYKHSQPTREPYRRRLMFDRDGMLALRAIDAPPEQQDWTIVARLRSGLHRIGSIFGLDVFAPPGL